FSHRIGPAFLVKDNDTKSPISSVPCNVPMLSANSHFRYAVKNCLLFITLVLIETSDDGFAAGRELSLQDSDDASTHLNFFRAASRGRQRVLSCARDAKICLDREKNPWGGSTCCFQQFCRDTLRDSNNCGACGACGQACAYGLVCCDGKCVDVQNDPHNCGSCFQECPGQ
ncbi:Stigma-specific Stig1 family protein, partial [Theobroma cacao]